MLHFLFITLLHILPSLLIISLFFLIFDVSFKSKSTSNKTQQDNEPDIDELELELQRLIENNNLSLKKDNLQQELAQTSTHIITAYLNTDKKNLKGFHLFQLIFSLIKNGDDDHKIIKILRHYLPSSPLAHLYALLKSCKKILKLSNDDKAPKELINQLKQNKIKSTLLYLQSKINQTLNLVALQPPALQQPIINSAAAYGLIFASFAQFYDKKSTEKILRLCNMIAPELFQYWHNMPEKDEITLPQKAIISPKKHYFFRN